MTMTRDNDYQESQRYVHARNMFYFGRRGVSDYNKTSKDIRTPRRKHLRSIHGKYTLKVLPREFDFNGHDMPRPDIYKIKLRNGKVIYVGTDNKKNIADFKKYALPYINKSFTDKELQMMNVFVEYPDRNLIKYGMHGVADTQWPDPGEKFKRFSLIGFYDKHSPETTVHEFVHALRNTNKKQNNKDADKDEIETVLETIARLPEKDAIPKNTISIGYYSHLKGIKNLNDAKRAIKHDRDIIVKKCNTHLPIAQRIKKCYKYTDIGKLKIPNKYKKSQSKIRNPENIERVFEIVFKDGKKEEIQIRPSKDRASIKTYLHKKYGLGIKIYEWRDGKKYRF